MFKQICTHALFCFFATFSAAPATPENIYYDVVADNFAKTVKKFPMVKNCICDLKISETHQQPEFFLIKVKMDESVDINHPLCFVHVFREELRAAAAKLFHLNITQVEMHFFAENDK